MCKIMEGAGHRGRWNKKAPVGTLLLLMCMFIPTLTLETCPPWDYTTDEGICCNKCSPGFKLLEKCHAAGQRSKCTPCSKGQYTEEMNYAKTCRRCKQCKLSKHEVQVSPCETDRNAKCACKDGYYKFYIDSETYDCLKCTKCGPGERETQTCNPEKNTVCECIENYYRFNHRCELCNNCSAECKHLCPPTTVKPNDSEGVLINIIAGVAVAALVLLVLVFLITYMATKRFTKEKLLKSSSQHSSDSPDSFKEILIVSENLLENSSVKPIPESPVSEQESYKLPDCIPLEIKVPDLIYTVLDLVPVLQMKQLVRTLGVKDTEIEQAEMDHRSCREAHYQMLRLWAERGSHAGGRGRGEMLHWPLLEELLGQLRIMHLERAAEELETKYGI
ncbi:tumor necrosis factor receptor superfamily member 1A isoform X2 [Mastacembelus armatus]|uniref:tumor necrosis factor receptor superfamily member 1A isoform X2 n=1 Tax=Mastacembelus armatus TaxID=205130 RepID=UPI000E458E86|nr:tumor necrosis factor receptor superfamily member 1A isoform X2 [Mastacembelus armatus]